jgi:hypothetical protein
MKQNKPIQLITSNSESLPFVAVAVSAVAGSVNFAFAVVGAAGHR